MLFYRIQYPEKCKCNCYRLLKNGLSTSVIIINGDMDAITLYTRFHMLACS